MYYEFYNRGCVGAFLLCLFPSAWFTATVKLKALLPKTASDVSKCYDLRTVCRFSVKTFIHLIEVTFGAKQCLLLSWRMLGCGICSVEILNCVFLNLQNFTFLTFFYSLAPSKQSLQLIFLTPISCSSTKKTQCFSTQRKDTRAAT